MQKLRRVITTLDVAEVFLETVLEGDVAVGFIIEHYGYLGQVSSSGKACKQKEG